MTDMKEEDEIKAFIDSNRDEFDEFDAPEGLWEAIEEKLPEGRQEKMVPLKTVLRIAAGVAILVAVAVYSLFQADKSSIQFVEEKSSVEDEQAVFTNYPELAEAAFYYQSKIDDAQTELATYEIDEADLESIELLENEMETLRAELGNQVDNERLIQAMMQIYQYKLEMLEDMLRQLRTIEKNRHEESTVVPI
jgi:hypothetical protein